MNNEILDLYESNLTPFFAIIRRYRGPGRLPDTDTIFNRSRRHQLLKLN